jgi:hypothetical protein
MTMNLRRIVFFIAFLSIISSTNVVYAQCAMCKATVEKGESPKASLQQRARGLNNGILYMMVVPYLLAGLIGFLWYKSSKKERERKNEIQRIIRRKMSSMQGGQNI